MKLELPVRFTNETGAGHLYTTLELEVEQTALLLVNCTFDNPPESPVGQVIRQVVAPTAAAVRATGMPILFLYGDDHYAPHSLNQELHATRRGKERDAIPWPAPAPVWVPGVEPEPGDWVLSKCGQNGFRGTGLDYCLRTNGITTLLCAGFSFKSSLFYTMVGAADHNYRVIFLRDGTHPPGENEYPDTHNDELAEQGWVRLVLTRMIEEHLGYSSTCEQLCHACAHYREGQQRLV
jgi:nicotinamidase-related amidase